MAGRERDLAVAPDLYYWGRRVRRLFSAMRALAAGEGRAFDDIEAVRMSLDARSDGVATSSLSAVILLPDKRKHSEDALHVCVVTPTPVASDVEVTPLPGDHPATWVVRIEPHGDSGTQVLEALELGVWGRWRDLRFEPPRVSCRLGGVSLAVAG